MDVDAFAAFEEAGDPFDPDTAARLEKFILSAGGSEPALSGKPSLAPIDQSGLRTLTPAQRHWSEGRTSGPPVGERPTRLLDAARPQARDVPQSGGL